MTKAREVLDLFEKKEKEEEEEYEKLVKEAVMQMMLKKKKKTNEADMGAGGEFSPYRNKFGELSNKKSAVLMLDDEGEWFRMKGGKKGKKINMEKFGRAARERGQNVRAYDGAKLN